MKNFIVLLAMAFVFNMAIAQPHPEKYPFDIQYFIPLQFPVPGYSSIPITNRYDERVPQPKQILGFEIGEQYADWNDVLKYMNALARTCDRVTIKEYGRTYQHRPFIQVIITSPANLQKLEQIRLEHLQLTDRENSGKLDITQMPVVVNLMSSVHGNEASGMNASLATAYFFAASDDETVKKILDQTVLIITPGLNPDGINRFASWVNTTRSFQNVTDLNSREFTEPWPSSRTNHYWADCNRDWLMAQHPEGQNAIAMYMEWMPNVVNDHHEMSGDCKGLYFSPGHPLRTHPFTPQQNQDLTMEISSHTAAALDKIGTLYFSKEGYDDYYYGKGASYGDMQGSVCILLEQVASRGYLRPTSAGLMLFANTIRNQSHTAITTVFASWRMKDKLLEYQRQYFINTAAQAAKDPVKGYVFNTRGRKGIQYHFLKNMECHHIEVYKLKKDISTGGKIYLAADSYIVPTNQKHYTKVRTVWENMTKFADSTFYDISTWTFPHAFNLQYASLESINGLMGEKVENTVFPQGKVIGGKSDYAYVFENREFYTPKFIAELLRKGLYVRAAKKPFTWSDGKKTNKFGYGTLIVQLQNQPLDADQIYRLMTSLAEECGVDVYSMKGGMMRDFDLGSPSNEVIQMPHIAIIVGRGMGAADCGEIWFMLDQWFQIPPALIEFTRLHKTDLSKYNVIILANGTPTETVPAVVYEKLKNWVDRGGTLIATGNAYTIANKAKLTDIRTVPDSKSFNPEEKRIDGTVSPYKIYASKAGAGAGNSVRGVILQCCLDTTSPLGWGYDNEEIAVMRRNSVSFQIPEGSYNVPLYYSPKPYLSGCISAKNVKKIAGTPAIIVTPAGKGNVIFINDDLNFRSYWMGANKIFMNAIFFSRLY